jgi:hypothetical protein
MEWLVLVPVVPIRGRQVTLRLKLAGLGVVEVRHGAVALVTNCDADFVQHAMQPLGAGLRRLCMLLSTEPVYASSPGSSVSHGQA